MSVKLNKFLFLLLVFFSSVPHTHSFVAKINSNFNEFFLFLPLSLFLFFFLSLEKGYVGKLRLSETSVLFVPVLLALLGCVSIIYSFNYPYDYSYESALVHIVRNILYFFLLLLVFRILTVYPIEEKVFKILAFGFIYTLLYVFVFWLQNPVYYYGLPFLHGRHISYEFVASRNVLGFYFSISIPVFLYLVFKTQGIARFFWSSMLFLFATALILTLSRGSWLSAFFGASVFFVTYFKFNKLVVYSLMIFPFLTFLIIDRFHFFLDWGVKSKPGIRFNFVVDAIDLMLIYPYFGVGPSNYHVAAVYHGLLPTRDPHNSLFHLSSEYGVIAFFTVLVFFVYLFFRFLILLNTKRNLNYSTSFSVASVLVLESFFTGMVFTQPIGWLMLSLSLYLLNTRNA